MRKQVSHCPREIIILPRISSRNRGRCRSESSHRFAEARTTVGNIGIFVEDFQRAFRLLQGVSRRFDAVLQVWRVGIELYRSSGASSANDPRLVF